MKRKRHFILPGIAVAVTVLATPVIAAIQIFSVDYGAFSSPLPIGSSEGLANSVQFDPSRGTLTGVTLTLSSFEMVASEVYNPGGVSTAYTGATAKMPITVSALGGLTTTAAGNAGPFAGVSTGPGISVAGTAPIISLQNTVSVSPMDFGFYEGADALSFTVTVDSSVESFSGAARLRFSSEAMDSRMEMWRLMTLTALSLNRGRHVRDWLRWASAELNSRVEFGGSDRADA